MQQYFDQINKIISGKKTSLRVSFMLRDVVDLRKNKWVPRREENSYLYNYLYDPQNKGKMHGFYNSFLAMYYSFTVNAACRASYRMISIE